MPSHSRRGVRSGLCRSGGSPPEELRTPLDHHKPRLFDCPSPLQQPPDAWLSGLSYVNVMDVPENWEKSWFVMADSLRRVTVPGLTERRLQQVLMQRVGPAWFTGVLARLHNNVFKVRQAAGYW